MMLVDDRLVKGGGPRLYWTGSGSFLSGTMELVHLSHDINEAYNFAPEELPSVLSVWRPLKNLERV
jgi:hypothetical protein